MPDELKKWLGELQDKWHIVLLIIVLVWQVSAYKTMLETHLGDIDRRLDTQGNAIQWLVRHTPTTVQQDLPPALDQPMKGKPESYAVPQNLTGYMPQQSADIPATINER